MQVILLFVSLLGLVAANASSSFCYTAVASTKGPARLLTTTATTTPTAGCTKTVTHITTYYVTHTPTTRVTSTRTKVVTDGSNSVATSTVIANTTTIVSTITTASTAFSTVSATATAPTSTTTVPTSSGFIPVQSSLPGSYWNGSYGGPDTFQRRLKRGVAKNPLKNLHPQSVECLEVAALKCRSTVVSASIYTVTTTATTTKTKTQVHVTTSTTMISATTTTDITVTPTASSTATSYTTTVTYSTTTTVATFTPSAVFYEVCDSNNLADKVNTTSYGTTNIAFIYGYYNYGEYTYGYSRNATNGYDCCVAALMSPHYTAAFELEVYPIENLCQLIASGTPGAGQGTANNSFAAFLVNDTAQQFSIVGNLYQGVINASSYETEIQ